MRYLKRPTRTRPRCRVDSARPMRQANEVTARESERLGAERLADAILALREQRSLSQEELATLFGLALKTIQRIEKAKISPRAATFGKIDRGAGWKPGSARALVRDGIPPQPLDEETIRRDARREYIGRLRAIQRAFPAEYVFVQRAIDELDDEQIERVERSITDEQR